MASSRQWQVGSVMALCLLASTAACEQRPPTATIGQPVALTSSVTSLVSVTAPEVVVPVDQITDCVEVVQLGAYVGTPDLATMWEAAGQNVQRLRENCTSLGRGAPEALAAISQRRVELEAYLGLTSTTTSTTPAAGG